MGHNGASLTQAASRHRDAAVIVTYVSGVRILKQHLGAIRRGDIRVLMFFLGSRYDYAFLKEVKEIDRDIDQLTGSHCLAVAFVPPPQVSEMAGFQSIDDVWPRRKDDPDGLADYVDAMTRNTYELARYLGVADELPAIAFVSTDSADEYALLHMSGRTLHEVYPSIRKVFAEWYQSNKTAIDADNLARLAPRDHALPHGVRTAIEDAIRERVVPVVAAAFDELLAQQPRLPAAKMRRMVHRLRKHPRDVKALADFMRHEKLSVPFDGQMLDATRFEREFARMCEACGVEVIASTADASRAAPLTPFPLSSVRAIDRSAQLKSFASSASGILAKSKDAAGVLGGILRLFGL